MSATARRRALAGRAGADNQQRRELWTITLDDRPAERSSQGGDDEALGQTWQVLARLTIVCRTARWLASAVSLAYLTIAENARWRARLAPIPLCCKEMSMATPGNEYEQGSASARRLSRGDGAIFWACSKRPPRATATRCIAKPARARRSRRSTPAGRAALSTGPWCARAVFHAATGDGKGVEAHGAGWRSRRPLAAAQRALP